MAIAKNDKFTGIEKLDGEMVKKVMNDAVLKDKTKSNAGAKKLPENEKLSTSMIVYFTPEEKKIMQEHCKSKKVAFSVFVRGLLNDMELI